MLVFCRARPGCPVSPCAGNGRVIRFVNPTRASQRVWLMILDEVEGRAEASSSELKELMRIVFRAELKATDDSACS
jgi:hypothetical protein